MRSILQSSLVRSTVRKLLAFAGWSGGTNLNWGPAVSVAMRADSSLEKAELALALLNRQNLIVEDSPGVEAVQHAPGPSSDLMVAIIVPTFGDSKYLGDCLASVAQQTYRHWTCYIVDDASPDETAEVVKEVAKDDPRFILIRSAVNCGLAAARNIGLSAATEDLIQFLDADDMLTPWALECRVNAFANSGPGWAGAHGQILQCTEETLLEDVGRWRHRTGTTDRDFFSSGGESPFTVHAPLTRRDLVLSVGGFDETWRNGAEDWEFWSRLLRTGAKFVAVNQVVGAYRQRPGSMIRDLKDLHLDRAARLFERANQPARWSNGEPTACSLGFESSQRLLREYRRRAQWEGLAIAGELVEGSTAVSSEDTVGQTTESRGIAQFGAETFVADLTMSARRGLIRGLGLSVNCVDRLSETAMSNLERASEIATGRLVSAFNARIQTELTRSIELGDAILEVDLVLPEHDTVLFLAHPGDLAVIPERERNSLLIVDLAQAGAVGVDNSRGLEQIAVCSLSEFLLRHKRSENVSYRAANPPHPFLRSEVVSGLDVQYETLQHELILQDTLPESSGFDYRRQMWREESVLDPASLPILAGLKNKHEGELCVIVGNGPSLNETDLDLVCSVPFFAVNSVFLLGDRLSRSPDYYVVEDTAVFKDNTDDIILFEAGLKLFPSIYRERYLKRAAELSVSHAIAFFRMNQGFYGRSTGALGYPRFSYDPTQRLYCGQSVTMMNLQLAYWMGFKEVALVGMDFSYTVPDDADVSGNLIVSRSDDPNHFDSRYFGAGKTWKDPKLDRVLQNYALINSVFREDGRRIVNATSGGKLELFERCSLDAVVR